MNGRPAWLFLALFFCVPAFADGQLLDQAERAAERRDWKNADFAAARFLGLTSRPQDLEPFLKKRRLEPKAFLSGELDKDFVDWFERALYARWGVAPERVRPKHRSFEIASTVWQGRYFVTVVAYPQLEAWYLMENGAATRRLLLALGSAADPPLVFFGEIFQGKPSFGATPLRLEVGRRALHYLWRPEFHDATGDGVPELWLRYNLAWGNGFAQELAVYRIDGTGRLRLLRKFTGENEGVARRLPDGRIEVASGFSERIGAPRFEFDKHRVETWKYDEGDFSKIDETVVPHIYRSDSWKSYAAPEGQ